MIITIITLPSIPALYSKLCIALRTDTNEAEDSLTKIHSTHQSRPRNQTSNSALRVVGYPAS